MKKIISIIRFIVYFFINLFIKPSKRINKNSLLIIRLDAIGDYVLFRNFIEIIKRSDKYKNYNITLLGNSAWKKLALELDSEFIDNFIWIDRNKFNKNIIYRYNKLQEIVSSGYEIALSSVYSREFFIDDNIVKLLTAEEKIGSIGDLSNIKKWQKNISDKYYTKLINANSEITFEFNRNKEFFENFLEVKISIIKPRISLELKKLKFKLPSKYVILFIGASANFRKWNIKKFVEVGKYLKNNHVYEIVLCGANSDTQNALEFSYYFKDHYIDLVGKTSLLELLGIIARSDLMVSNETLAPHLAVALGVNNIFVISNGNHYGRFTPYPKNMTKDYYVIYHPEIEKYFDNYKKLSNSYGFGSSLNIDDISAKNVIKKIDKVLKYRINNNSILL